MNPTIMAERLLQYLHPFFSLSYPVETPKNPDSFVDATYYTKGRLDVCIVITCIAVMAVLRDVCRLYIFEPFARWKLTNDWISRKRKQALRHASKPANFSNGHINGVNGYLNGTIPDPRPSTKDLRQLHRRILRFAEQGWSVVYYTVLWFYGLYIHHNLPTRIFDPVDLWLGYPHIPLAGPLKFYYLLQTAFYIHQILIINAEARRKDHVQMMTHHVITVFLLAASYYCNFNRIGCLILVLMDWCDIFLPLAKMLRYINISQRVTDAIFGWFLISWFITRHVLFIFTIVSTFRDCPRLLPFDFSPQEGRYLNNTVFLVFSFMLIALQILQMIWFGMICRVAWRVLTTNKGASDDRSDESDADMKED